LKKRTMLGNYARQNGRNIRFSNESSAGNKNKRKSTSGYTTGARADSQVGTAMAEVTGQWVAAIILIGLVLTIIFTYHERDATRPSTMVVLHNQVMRSANEFGVEKAVNTSVSSVIPDLYEYTGESDTLNETIAFRFDPGIDVDTLREREKLKIIVEDSKGRTEGTFENKREIQDEALVELLMTIFVLVVWFLGVTAFAGPVMTLVITPIERMVRLLGMLMVDPLGYQTNSRFKKFMFEEDALVKKSQWTKEVLKGMETSFLMSTILRIGSLMKVGFGSAGVEIIRHNLQKGQNKNMLILNSQGSTVSCIFLFCDIRQFTDATECLQEEVFVFTNRIAAVVHSICHSYGGSANKNVGDAFLVSWLLEDDSGNGTRFGSRSSQALVAKHNQADKALLSVVKICMSLHYDDYYVQTMSDNARTALLNKLKNRPGPVVQMGFGLHAGKAVQGAIGSQRKIDATYVSEAVERAEYLESSTKRYELKMLMSDTFHRLLHSSNRRRCRKIDQIMFANEDDEEDEPSYEQGDIMELYTYDMDIDALWRSKKSNKTIDGLESSISETDQGRHTSGAQPGRAGQKGRTRRISVRSYAGKRESAGSDEMKSGSMSATSEAGQSMVAAAKIAAEFGGSTYFEVDANEDAADPGELVLPTGPQLYSSNVWLQEDMRRIRHQYTSVVFQTFSSGLQRFYEKDWPGARHCFEAILERFDDGPSKYFLKEMRKHNWTPPADFQPFGKA
jgi:class 3 adenylate cyclase